MNASVLELEGTWEEAAAYAPEIAGRHVHLTVPPVEETSHLQSAAAAQFSTAGSLLKFAGTWEGDDLRECLDIVCQTRSQACSSPVPSTRTKTEMYLHDTNHCSLLMEGEAAA